MPQPTHDNIAPLVADLQESGRSVRVTFRCPVSGQSVQSSHSVSRDASSSSQMMNTAKRSMMYGLQSAVSQTIRSVFGYNMVGRVAGDVTRQAMYSATRSATNQNTLSSSEKQQAVVDAFQKVARQFVWDEGRGHWISSKAAQELMSPFEQQLANHPVTHGYDRTILARMLVEIARADGRLSNDESGWLNEFIGPDLGTLGELTSRPPLSDPELGEVSRGDVRVTMLMVAWTMAIVDENFDRSEQQVLQRLSSGLRMSNPQIQAARDAAQGYILDQALERMFTWGGHDAHSRTELFALAERLGMSQQEAQVAEARYQRRKGF
ncbi:MAG: tellurite resistance protein [Myxococcota bacterium]|jgi:tellurite resistance protein